MSASSADIVQKTNKEQNAIVTNSSENIATPSPTETSTTSATTYPDQLKKFFKDYGISSLPEDLYDERDNKENQENHLSKGKSVHSPSSGQFDIYTYFLESLTAESFLEETMLYVLATEGNIHNRRVCMFWQSPQGLCAFIFTFQGINHNIDTKKLFEEISSHKQDPTQALENENIVILCKNLYKKIDISFLSSNQKNSYPKEKLEESVRNAYATTTVNIMLCPAFNIPENSIRNRFNRCIISYLKWGALGYAGLFHQNFKQLVAQFELMSTSANKELSKSASIQLKFLLRVCEYRSLNQELRNSKNKNSLTLFSPSIATVTAPSIPTSNIDHLDAKHVDEKNNTQSGINKGTAITAAHFNVRDPETTKKKPSKRQAKNLKKKTRIKSKKQHSQPQGISAGISATKNNYTENSSAGGFASNNIGLSKDEKELSETGKTQKQEQSPVKNLVLDFEFIHGFLISQHSFKEGCEWLDNAYKHEIENLWKHFQEQVRQWKGKQDKKYKEALVLSNTLIDRLKLITNKETEIPWIVPQILYEALTAKDNPEVLKEILGQNATQAIMTSEHTRKIISEFYTLLESNPEILKKTLGQNAITEIMNSPFIRKKIFEFYTLTNIHSPLENEMLEEILNAPISFIKHRILKNYTKILDAIVSKNPGDKLTILQNTLKAYYQCKTKIAELDDSSVLKNASLLPIGTILKFMRVISNTKNAYLNPEQKSSMQALLEDLITKLQKTIIKNTAWEKRQKQAIAKIKASQSWHEKTLNFLSEYSFPGLVGNLVQRAFKPIVHLLANDETLISLKEILKENTEHYEGFDEAVDSLTEENFLTLLNLAGATLSLYATGPLSLFNLEFIGSSLITDSLTTHCGIPKVDPFLSTIAYPSSLHGLSASSYYRCTQSTMAVCHSVYNWSPDPLLSVFGGIVSSKIIISLLEKILDKFLVNMVDEQLARTKGGFSGKEQQENQISIEQRNAQRKERRAADLHALSQLIYHIGYSQFNHVIQNVRQEYRLLIAKIFASYENLGQYENQIPGVKSCIRLTIEAPSTSNRILSALNPFTPLLLSSNIVKVGCLQAIPASTSNHDPISNSTTTSHPTSITPAIPTYIYKEHYCQLTNDGNLAECKPNNLSPHVPKFVFIEADATKEFHMTGQASYQRLFKP